MAQMQYIRPNVTARQAIVGFPAVHPATARV